MTEAARYTFILGDAARAMGMPAHPRLEFATLCILIDPNGFLTIGHAVPIDGSEFNADLGAQIATLKAEEAMFQARGYHALEAATHSEPLQAAIRLEKAGLPAGRYDVNPMQVPALEVEPEGFTMARSSTFPVTEGLVDPEVVAKAWEDVRAQIAQADPPFPITMKGYTVILPVPLERDGIPTEIAATLTVYA